MVNIHPYTHPNLYPDDLIYGSLPFLLSFNELAYQMVALTQNNFKLRMCISLGIRHLLQLGLQLNPCLDNLVRFNLVLRFCFGSNILGLGERVNLLLRPIDLREG